MPISKRQEVIRLLRQSGTMRSRDFVQHGISRGYLHKLYVEGLLDRPSRGLYSLMAAEPSEHRSLLEACQRVPNATVCLLSALRFHDLTTQAPFEVWLAINRKAREPKVDYPSIRIVRFSDAARNYGVERHVVEGTSIPVYSPAKTVADCFKYRNKIGLDVAIEALRDCLKQKKANMDELWEASRVCRQTNVIRPYLESVT